MKKSLLSSVLMSIFASESFQTPQFEDSGIDACPEPGDWFVGSDGKPQIAMFFMKTKRRILIKK